jgi:Protein of unknown function (DUF3152)
MADHRRRHRRHAGRVPPPRPSRPRWWGALLAFNVVGLAALVIAGTLYVTTYGIDLPPGAGQGASAAGGPAVTATPFDIPARQDDRVVQGEEGTVEPPRVSPPTGKVVNGRLQPKPVNPPQSGTGTFTVVPGTQEPVKGAEGPVVKYIVEVERGLPFDGGDFAKAVHATLNDPRSWGHDGKLQFERVDHGSVQIRVSLSSAVLTDRLCFPLRTFGRVSCWDGSRAVINAERWGLGADTYGDDILSYREYVVNHEVGHGLGHDHIHCPRPGALAPVMVQQTKSLEGCRPNQWPYP